jgi:DNA polymerase-3 subunit chi
MTRIDFYVLDFVEPRGLGLLACKLTEKVWRMGHRVYLHATDPAQAQALDDLLWTFRDGSFVPHEIYVAGEDDPAPILIGCEPDPQLEPDVLINLTDQVPACFSRFPRLAELVDADPGRREASRKRWSFYRDRGYPLHKHDM